MCLISFNCVLYEKNILCFSFGTKEELSSDPHIHELVVEQIKQWSDIKEKHRSSTWELKKQHLLQQHDVLKGLLETALAAKIKQQEAHHERFAKFPFAVEPACNIVADMCKLDTLHAGKSYRRVFLN